MALDKKSFAIGIAIGQSMGGGGGGSGGASGGCNLSTCPASMRTQTLTNKLPSIVPVEQITTGISEVLTLSHEVPPIIPVTSIEEA